MTDSPTTSVVIVDTDAHVLARSALDHTLNRFAAADVIVFSDDPAPWRPYNMVVIPKIRSLKDYNRLLLTQLARHVRTDFALVIQYDGFAIDAAAFTDDFYSYDYIGAPWPPRPALGRGAAVGNGGFSLRSKRLLDAVAAHEASIDFDVSEDATIALVLRGALEATGLAFAPVPLARRFSVETDQTDMVAPFGFHGLHWLPVVYAESLGFLIDNLPTRCFQADSFRLKYLRMGFSKLDEDARRLFEARVATVQGRESGAA